MPRSQGPDLVSLLPGCGPSLGFPLRQMRTQPLVGAAGRAGLGGRSRGALAGLLGLPGPARGGISRPFHPAAPGGATGPKGCRRDSSPHARPGEEETPTSAPLAPGPKPAQCGPQVAPRGRGWASLAAPCPAEGRRGAGGRGPLGPSRAACPHRRRRAAGPPGHRDPRGCLGLCGRTPADRGRGPDGRAGSRPSDPRAAGPAPLPVHGPSAGPRRRRLQKRRPLPPGLSRRVYPALRDRGTGCHLVRVHRVWLWPGRGTGP